MLQAPCTDPCSRPSYNRVLRIDFCQPLNRDVKWHVLDIGIKKKDGMSYNKVYAFRAYALTQMPHYARHFAYTKNVIRITNYKSYYCSIRGM